MHHDEVEIKINDYICKEKHCTNVFNIEITGTSEDDYELIPDHCSECNTPVELENIGILIEEEQLHCYESYFDLQYQIAKEDRAFEKGLAQ